MNFKTIAFLTAISLSLVLAEETPKETGKQNVISQLESLFQSHPAPIQIPEDAIEEPYMNVIEGTDNRSTLIYRCRYSDCQQISDGIEPVISRNGLIEEAEDKNMIIISDSSDRIEEIKQVIIAMDIPIPQILVEAKVIEVYTTNEYQQELTFNYDEDSKFENAAGNYVDKPDMLNFSPYTLGVEGQINNMGYLVNWLKSANDAQILSSPNIVVSLGSQGNIVTGEDLPIQSTSTTGSTVNTDIKYKRTGIRLDVTPIRINNKTVKLKVNPEVSTVTRYETFNDTRTPVVSVRDVETELSVQDGEIIMLGGLYSTEELIVNKKVPFLGDIPLLGELFKSKDNSKQVKQLIFFMKVKIVRNSSATFLDIEEQAQQVREAGEAIKNSEKLFPKNSDEKDSGEDK